MELKDKNRSSHNSAGSFEVSVIIPTFNRKKTLELVLSSLERQTITLNQFEVIVSDDGSTDGTQNYLIQYAHKTLINFQYVLAKTNGGPAKARNAALDLAKGAVIVIIGDDIEVDEYFVKQHFQWHCMHPNEGDSLLGRVTWSEAIDPSNFMRWLESGGRHFFFRYADFISGLSTDCQNFYTCNVSVKRSLLFKTDLFDESFPYASHEDLELGERLRLQGMTLYYEKSICGYHRHYLYLEGIARRVYLMGYSAKIFWDKVPDRSSDVRKILRKSLVYLFSLPGIWEILKKLLSLPSNPNDFSPFRWKSILVLSYWLGLADSHRGIPIRKFD